MTNARGSPLIASLCTLFYKYAVQPYLMCGDAEYAHEEALAVLQWIGKNALVRSAVSRAATIRDRRLAQTAFGLRFPNPVGLAAGFDKNAVALHGLSALGFGFIEAGTITQYPQEGNPQPRMFRVPSDRAIINRLGFNNDGADAISSRLHYASRPLIPLGISIGKSDATPLERAIDDYLYTFRRLYSYADYFAVNVSSPNTPGLRNLQQSEQLAPLLKELYFESRRLAEKGWGNGKGPKPILVKISPDLSWAAIDEIVRVCGECGVAGIIAVNTTVSRDGLCTKISQAGGLSGKPLKERARNIVAHIAAQTRGTLPIIGVGGIFNAEDAYAMLKAGAWLVQLYTGFVYEGPFVASRINRGLLDLMKQEGVERVADLRR